MEAKIIQLVDEINSINGKEDLMFCMLGRKYSIQEFSDTREPKFHFFNSPKECYDYLISLRKIKIGNKVIKKSEDIAKLNSYEIWYNGEYLGIFKNSSCEGACREALKDKGLTETMIAEEIRTSKRISGNELRKRVN